MSVHYPDSAKGKIDLVEGQGSGEGAGREGGGLQFFREGN